MKDHEIAAKINELCQIAIDFGDADQLRERLRAALVDDLKDYQHTLIELDAMNTNYQAMLKDRNRLRDELRAIKAPPPPVIPIEFRCSVMRMNAGKTYPRTCIVCGLGPCTVKNNTVS